MHVQSPSGARRPIRSFADETRTSGHDGEPRLVRDPDSTPEARKVRTALKSHLGDHKYRMWFEHTGLAVADSRLEVTASNAYVYKWIESNFTEDLERVAADSLGRPAQIDLRVAADTDAPGGDAAGRADHGAGVLTEAGPGAASPDARRRHTVRRAALRRLDEFVVGQSNRLAYSTACRLLEATDAQGVSPLFIHGECGLGKTHLLQGICRQFQAMTGRPEDVRYVTGEQFTNEYIASIRKNTLDTFRRRVRKLDLLAIDDVHFLSNKVRTQGEFLHTLDAIDLTGARIVLASDEHPRVIKRFSQALVSRFLSGMVVQIDRPDRETRIAIVKRLAAARSLPISDAATEAVASRCVASVRELEGAVTKLAALWTLCGDGPSGGDGGATADEAGIVLVEQLFKDHGWQPPVPVRIGTVIDVVCRRVGIGRTDLMGTSRHRRVVLARALVAYLGRSLTTLSYPELARAIGRPYHSTVHTAEQRLCRQLVSKESVQAGDGQEPIALTELVDQLRHEVARATTRN